MQTIWGGKTWGKKGDKVEERASVPKRETSVIIWATENAQPGPTCGTEVESKVETFTVSPSAWARESGPIPSRASKKLGARGQRGQKGVGLADAG